MPNDPEGAEYRELEIPPDAVGTEGAAEVLRAWIVEGGLSISFIRAFEDPAVWGILLADVARHAARSFEREGLGDAEEVLTAIRTMFATELDQPSDRGVTSVPSSRGH